LLLSDYLHLGDSLSWGFSPENKEEDSRPAIPRIVYMLGGGERGKRGKSITLPTFP